MVGYRMKSGREFWRGPTAVSVRPVASTIQTLNQTDKHTQSNLGIAGNGNCNVRVGTGGNRNVKTLSRSPLRYGCYALVELSGAEFVVSPSTSVYTTTETSPAYSERSSSPQIDVSLAHAIGAAFTMSTGSQVVRTHRRARLRRIF